MTVRALDWPLSVGFCSAISVGMSETAPPSPSPPTPPTPPPVVNCEAIVATCADSPVPIKLGPVWVPPLIWMRIWRFWVNPW